MTAPPIAAETTAARTRASGPVSPPVRTAYRRPINSRNGSCFARILTITGSCWTAVTMRRRCDREVDHLGEHELARPPEVLVGFGRVERRFDLHEVDLDGREDDLVLGLELVVDRGLRHADGVGDHLQRRPVDTVLGEQVERGGDDPGLRGGARDGPQPADRGLGEAHATKVADRLADPSRSATLRDRPGRTEGERMSEQELDQNLQEFLEIRQPGIDYAEHAKDDFALQIGVDLDNYKKFPRVDDNVTYKKEGHDRRGEIGDLERRHAGLQRSVQGRPPLLGLLAGAARPHALDESRVLRAARRGVGRRAADPQG